MVNFRCSSHGLMIEKGRYYGLERDFRCCPYCEVLVEDEYHFLLICPLYTEIREKFLPNTFTNQPSEDKFLKLMSSGNETVIRNCAMYIFYALKERSEFLKAINGQ